MGELLLGCGRYDDAVRALRRPEASRSDNARPVRPTGQPVVWPASDFDDASRALSSGGGARCHVGRGPLRTWSCAARCRACWIKLKPLTVRRFASTPPSPRPGSRWRGSRRSAATGMNRARRRVGSWRYARMWRTPTGGWPSISRELYPITTSRRCEMLLEHKYVSHSLKAGLNFALGAVFDARGLYAQAAEHFEAANSLQSVLSRPQKASHSIPTVYSRMIDRLIVVVQPRPARTRPKLGRPRSATDLRRRFATLRNDAGGADPGFAFPSPWRG